MAAAEELFGSDSDNESGDGSPAHSGSGAASAPGSPAHDGSPPGTPRSGSSGPPGTPGSSVSGGSPTGSPAQSGSGSPASLSGSGSPHGSRSPSPVGARSGSRSRSRSGSRSGSSVDGSKSKSVTPHGSRSPSPTGSHRSGSPGGSSRSGSPAGSHRSVSPAGSHISRSPAGSHKSGSPAGSHRSGSPAGSHRSGSPAGSHRSGSPAGSHRSGSPAGSHRSGSPAGSHRSGSPAGSHRSGSPAGSHRSGSPARSEMSLTPPGSPKTPDIGDDSEDDIGKKKTKRILDSDDEMAGSDAGDKAKEVSATVDDLFGDADDISSDSDAGEEKRPEEVMPMGEEGEQAQEEEEEIPETRIEVEIPKINTNLGKQLHFVKLPNFLSVETRPFDPTSYEDEIDEDEVMDEEGRTRLKLKVENTIRWRTAKDEEGNEMKDEFGDPVRESNARVVRWSDGSMSLHLGSEIFDVHTMLLQGDYNHLFIRQGTGLQGQAVFKTKLTFRPHSTESFTHRKMTMSMADRSSKTQKVKVLPIAGTDPESQRTEMIKKEEEKLRASIRRESQQRRIRERAHQRGLNAPYLEDDDGYDDDNAISLSAIKSKYKQGSKQPRPNIYSSDSEDSSSDEETNRKRLMKAKKLDSDEESGGGGSNDEAPKKKAKLSDSEDENAVADGDHSSGEGSN